MLIDTKWKKTFLFKWKVKISININDRQIKGGVQHTACKTLLHDSPMPVQVKLWNLTFPNPVGVAAGFDKGAEAAMGLAHIGFGFVEVFRGRKVWEILDI